MRIIKTEGIILRVMNYLESSKIVTCFTPDHGKISLLAKGARRVKSRLGGSLDLSQHVAIVFYQKETRELQTLSHAEIIHSFQNLQFDLRHFSLAAAILELIQKLELTNEPNPRLFRQTLETLHGFEHAQSPALIFYQFIWRWLETAGFHPKFRHCMVCGKISNESRVIFSISQGGYYCSNCVGISANAAASGQQNSLDISQKCLKLLLCLRENSAKIVADVRVSEDLISELKELSWRFLRYHSDEIRELKTMEFLKRLQSQKNLMDVQERGAM